MFIFLNFPRCVRLDFLLLYVNNSFDFTTGLQNPFFLFFLFNLLFKTLNHGLSQGRATFLSGMPVLKLGFFFLNDCNFLLKFSGTILNKISTFSSLKKSRVQNAEFRRLKSFAYHPKWHVCQKFPTPGLNHATLLYSIVPPTENSTLKIPKCCEINNNPSIMKTKKKLKLKKLN